MLTGADMAVQALCRLYATFNHWRAGASSPCKADYDNLALTETGTILWHGVPMAWHTPTGIALSLGGLTTQKARNAANTLAVNIRHPARFRLIPSKFNPGVKQICWRDMLATREYLSSPWRPIKPTAVVHWAPLEQLLEVYGND